MNDKETADYYQKRAAEYEKIYYREVPERRKEIDDEADRLRDLVRGKRVLELACGTGYWTAVMSETASAITAVDLWPEMIAEAKKKRLVCPVEFAASDMFAYKAEPKG
ncbi:MAG: class I SAM-dependent methyltransferase, partial [Candidatus Zixiibacteriota bacterium]